MFCKKCGAQVDDCFKFCSICGAELSESGNGNGKVNPGFAEVITKAFSSNLFLVIAILLSVEAGFSLLFGSLPVVQLAAMIIMWFMYSAAKLDDGLTKLGGYFKGMRIVTTVEWVLNWVAFGILAVASVLLIISFSTVQFGVMPIDKLMESAGASLVEIDYLLSTLGISASQIIDLDFILIIITVVLAVMAVWIAIYNIFYVRNLRKCAKSFEASATNGTNNLECLSAVKNWLMVLGILTAVGVLGASGISFVVTASSAARMIVLSVWLGGLEKKLAQVKTNSFECEPEVTNNDLDNVE